MLHDERHFFPIKSIASLLSEIKVMNEAILIDRLKSLYEKMDEREKNYHSAITTKRDYNTLKSIRTGISLLKVEIQALEGILLDIQHKKF